MSPVASQDPGSPTLPDVWGEPSIGSPGLPGRRVSRASGSPTVRRGRKSPATDSPGLSGRRVSTATGAALPTNSLLPSISGGCPIIRGAASKYLASERLRILVEGNAAAIKGQIAGLALVGAPGIISGQRPQQRSGQSSQRQPQLENLAQVRGDAAQIVHFRGPACTGAHGDGDVLDACSGARLAQDEFHEHGPAATLGN